MDTSSDHIYPARTARAGKPMIKPHFSGRMVSSDVVISSVHSEKTHLKKLMVMMKLIIILLLLLLLLLL